MTPFLIALLYILLYAVIGCIVIELIWWIITQFFAPPPKIKQLLYALVGVVILIYLIQLLVGLPTTYHRLP